MNTEASPRPWRVGENSLGWKSCIEDADGKQIASCWGGDGVNCTEPAQSDAALIVAAVNERDRLRDLVKRMTNLVGEAPIDWFGASFVDTQVLLTEARAAIGEDAK